MSQLWCTNAGPPFLDNSSKRLDFLQRGTRSFSSCTTDTAREPPRIFRRLQSIGNIKAVSSRTPHCSHPPTSSDPTKLPYRWSAKGASVVVFRVGSGVDCGQHQRRQQRRDSRLRSHVRNVTPCDRPLKCRGRPSHAAVHPPFTSSRCGSGRSRRRHYARGTGPVSSCGTE